MLYSFGIHKESAHIGRRILVPCDSSSSTLVVPYRNKIHWPKTALSPALILKSIEEELEDSIDDAIGGDDDDGGDGDGDLLAEEGVVKDPVEVDLVAGKVSEFISCHTECNGALLNSSVLFRDRKNCRNPCAKQFVTLSPLCMCIEREEREERKKRKKRKLVLVFFVLVFFVLLVLMNDAHFELVLNRECPIRRQPAWRAEIPLSKCLPQWGGQKTHWYMHASELALELVLKN